MIKLRMMADMLEWTEMAAIENLSHWYCESSDEYDRQPATLWPAKMHHGTRAAIFPRITKAPFSEQHGLLVGGSRLGRFAASFVIQPETKVFSSEFLVESAFADPIIDVRIALTNVLEFAQAIFIMRIYSSIIERMHALSHPDIVDERNRKVGSETIEPVQITVEIDVFVVSSHEPESRLSYD